MRPPLRALLFLSLFACIAAPAAAQSDAPVGVRAAGMAGAFVAVADDASAVFWNPAGLAAGSYFTLVLDRNAVRTSDDTPAPRSGSGLFFGVGTPPLGVCYYRTHATRTDAASTESFIAHHTGVTLVQTVAPGVSVGAALKVVRGIAARAESPMTLDAAADLVGKASNKFDADVGVMASGGGIKAGIAVRNLFEPEFSVSGGGPPIPLERRIRVGVALRLMPLLTLAADADVTKTTLGAGRWRDAAIGAEARLTMRTWIRSGVHWNTAGRSDGVGAAPVGTAGASYMLRASLLADAQVSFGSPDGNRGWGIGARVVF